MEEQNIKDDPVLCAHLNSFRNKKDVEEEIRRSSKTLGHSSKGSEEVFHRRTIAHQLKVITKASAYVEIIIADTCKYRAQGERDTTSGSSRNPVQAYLSGLTTQQVRELHGEVQAALGDVMDTNRLMSAYSIPGYENADNSLEGCFYLATKDLPSSSPLLSPKGPYRSTDDNRALHNRLGIHNRHFIPIGFYYSKWLEKLRFHLDNREEARRSSSSSSGSSRSSHGSHVSRAEDDARLRQQRSPKRPKQDKEKGAPPVKPPVQEHHVPRQGKDYISQANRLLMRKAEREAHKMTSSSAAAPRKATHKELLEKRAAILDDRADTKLSLKDKAVFDYREERRLQYYQHGGGMDEDEVAFNREYDSEQFFVVQKLLEEGENNNNEGHGSAEQGQR
jgi:hypothetical protein